MMRFRLRPLLAIVGLAAALAMTIHDADARPGGGSSFGSRGSRTFSAPAATKTAPTTAKPFERTTTQPQPAAPRPGVAAAPSRPGLFNRPGLLGGLAAGFLGAGLLGMLFGHGLFSNLGGLASILGLLAQLALVAVVARLAWAWWQRRQQPQPAFAAAGGPQNVNEASRSAMSPVPLNSGGSFLHPQAAPEPNEPSDEIGLKGEDYDAFERLLGEIQSAYSAEDIPALRERATPEMFSYLSEELAEHQSRGVVAALSGVKLLQGDLSEAWREGNAEYATVAMRYEIVDQMLDRKTRAVVEGDPQPIEVTELWTFLRSPGGKWLLSGIQQTEGDASS